MPRAVYRAHWEGGRWWVGIVKADALEQLLKLPLGSVVDPTVTACGSVTVTGFTCPANITPAIKPPAIATWAHVRPIRENAFFISFITFLF